MILHILALPSANEHSYWIIGERSELKYFLGHGNEQVKMSET